LVTLVFFLALLTAQREWTFAEGAVTFAKSASNSLDIPSAQVIDDMLAYANELERIV
jgi:hypothetical protein